MVQSTNGQGLLQDKVILVTGAGRGLGRAVALELGREGACVVVNDFGSSSNGMAREGEGVADQVAAEINVAGGRAIGNAGDVSSFADAQQMVDQAIKTFGRLDAVVNNAGVFSMHQFSTVDPAVFDRTVKVHLYGTFNVSRAAAPHFQRQRSGAFLHVGSTAGLMGMSGAVSYCAAKGGIFAMSKAIALEMREFNVRSNAVAPSAASRLSSANERETELGLGGANAQRMASGSDKGVPEDVAGLFVYLLSEQAKDINGQIFGIRGYELSLYGQSRPSRMLLADKRWDVEGIAEKMAYFRGAFVPLESLQDVLAWKPV